MPERPLLVFPEPEEASRAKLGGGGSRVRRPDHDRQGTRLSPRFDQLQQAWGEVQQSAAGVDPEQVLVIETIGSIENLANAVRRIDGLEWMGELELDDIAPDEDFFHEDHPERELSGRLYLVMSNQRALEELLSLWRRYKDNLHLQFQRGLARFRYVFDTLKDIRRWGVQDRLLETGVLEAWRDDLSHDGDQPIRFEAELWFRANDTKRQANEQALRRLVSSQGGRLVTQCIIPQIAYHAIVGELPRKAIQEILDHPATELVRCDEVMCFRPVGQLSAGERTPEGESEAYVSAVQEPLPIGEPIVAVLDGLPLTNHALLVDRLVVDDPDDWAAQYLARDRVHGTAMASLIVHGDLSNNENALRSQVYVRPVMLPLARSLDEPRPEYMPEHVLPVDLIHRAIRRLFEGDGDEGPIAPSVRVVNLSIGDRSRPFDRAMSPLARLLDWLSVKYRILFVISAGNCLDDIDVGMTGADFDALSPDDREDMVVKAILRAGRMRRLLSPGESINSLTIGASHSDDSQVGYMGTRIDPFVRQLPSPVSPLGSGYRRSVKPDIIHPGGRQLYRRPVVAVDSRNARLELARFLLPPGCKVARPGSRGELNCTAHCVGTSNAAALVSRNAAICYEVLSEVLANQPPGIVSAPFVIPLLKALLVHGASWGDMGQRLREVINSENDGRQVKSLLTRWLGYGVPDFARALECTAQRATVLGFGELSDGVGHVFQLPLPPSLGSRREWRRLTVTLACLSPTASRTQKYRTASLWFEAAAAGLQASRTATDWQAVRRGTVQHEVFEGEGAVPLSSGDTLSIKVNCRKDAAKMEGPVPYGLVVSLEVAEGVDVAIYDEVRVRIAVPIEIRQAAGGANQ